MPQTVNVPSEISREQLLDVVRTLGLGESLEDLAALHIDGHGIRAEVYAHDENGNRYVAGHGHDARPAMHVVSIPVAAE